ncbi:hypothetical protein AZI86_10990 [Bdellovibrio bacteriovorus]|uniref:Sulfotransferase domain-containing protein n=1 Tax=Bdellovibrio bacteriovorus TaxID=959 RepID=A0A150WLR1_BDEBC|nr:sulfotransferase domain-containing protein [Bdellovibrio bacteriovorus]KYG64727.1 hypothetical protein AZI86_10990 [Bdellovibrio bacteriovorus]
MKKFVDVSGVGNSGKTAVSDILREFDSYYIPEHSFEFDLFRLPGGLLDLKHHLCEDWSPVRSHYAINAFLRVVDLIGPSPRRLNIFQTMSVTGNRYDLRFKGTFTPEAKKFVKSLVLGEYLAYWPYDFLTYGVLQRFWSKLLLKSGFRLRARSWVQLVDGENFSEKVSSFINKLFESTVDSNVRTIFFNNAFEAFNPVRSLDILKNSKSIIVIRDPRDIYVSGINAHALKSEDIKLQAGENDGINKSFLATDDLELFIRRYRTYMQHLYSGSDSRVLILQYENLVTKYDHCLEQIIEFLGEDKKNHIEKGRYFDPRKSSVHVGKWKAFSDQEIIRSIEKELPEYLWND